VVVVSSGAAVNGSPASGGYAGTKATQRFIAGYAQDESRRAGLDITEAQGITREEFRAASAANSHRKRATTLVELGDAAAFVASDRAAAMTGTVANLTGGIIVD
jgi:enoyl-[acyl-carrier-protein] reductase (NADH)